MKCSGSTVSGMPVGALRDGAMVCGGVEVRMRVEVYNIRAYLDLFESSIYIKFVQLENLYG